jgi:hypothetical protein
MTHIRYPGLCFFGLTSIVVATFVACGDSDSGPTGTGAAGGGGSSATSMTTSNQAGGPQGGGGSSNGGGGAAQGGGGAAQGGGGAAGGGGNAQGGGGGAGLCAGVVCTAKDDCHAVGTCDSNTGRCSNPALADNTTCDDQLTCKLGGTCQAAVCTAPSGNGTLDQSCLATAEVATISPENKPGQTFTVGAAGQLMGIELALAKCNTAVIAASGSIRLDVFDSTNATLGTARLAVSTITHACSAYPLVQGTVGTGLFDLSSACIAVTSGEVLHFELSEEGIDAGKCNTTTHFCSAGLTTTCTADGDCDITYGASAAGSDLYSKGTETVNGTAKAADDLDFKTFVR